MGHKWAPLARLVPLFAATTLLVACAGSPGGPLLPVAAGETSVAILGRSGDLRPVFLTVYPHPRHATYGDALLDLDAARRVDPTSDEFDAALARHDLASVWDQLEEHEGFLLLAALEPDGPLLLSGSRDDAGARWLAGAMRQLTIDMPEGRRIRECRIVDGPGFALRGSARPQSWERSYRANLDWGGRIDDERFVAVPTVAPASPLDATPRAVDVIARELRAFQERGAQRFVLDFEDAEFGLTSETEILYDTYTDALVSFVSAIRARLMVEDPEAVIYVLPHTHWWNDERLDVFASALHRSGGLGPGTGIVLTGPEVASRRIDADELAAALDAFGMPVAPALVYDRSGGASDWGPLQGRDPALRAVADGVVGGRGSPVSRLTRLDWLWNPSGYSPERSWRRAVYELAGPQGFHALREACVAFRERVPRAEAAAAVERFADADPGDWHGPIPKPELVDQLRRDLARLAGSAEFEPPSARR